ncbi:MAG: hypothetical protein E7558_08990 [Ruminococcaceae bacterium]|nr:hypothetical protein [Oscillospiraceae bacterium]
MTNEWLEFKAYTDAPIFNAGSKQSTAFMGRFSTTIIKKNKGFNRIFTVLARGFLFHNADGTLRTDDPYDRTEEARRFLCAWCSLPYETVTNKVLKFHTSFPELHSEFPNIIDENGAGWYYIYLHSLSDYIKKNKDNVTKKLHCFAEKKTLKAIESTWANKLIQYQYSIYNNRSSADFPLLFDTAIADALVLGPLRTEAVELSDKELQKIKAYGVNAKTERLMITLAEYYIANKDSDSDWVIIPRTNISAYLGSATYMESYEDKIPEGFMEKKPEMGGVSAVRIKL